MKDLFNMHMLLWDILRFRLSREGFFRELHKGNGNPLQYSCLRNPIDREAWLAIIWGYKRVRHNLATKQQLGIHELDFINTRSTCLSQ